MSFPIYSNEDLESIQYAAKCDQSDPISKFRQEFHMPGYKESSEINQTGEMVYLCGNSLGLQPKLTQQYMMEELTKWQNLGVEGHFLGTRPWATIDEKVVQLAVPIVGAESIDEVAIMNSLSVNLHLLLLSFYQPTTTRFKIMMESGAFCSDNHIIRSQLRFHGRNQETDLILLQPRENESTLRTEDILSEIEKQGESIALILLPGIQFYTGQLFNMKEITKKGHEYGSIVGFDLAHAVGNVPLELHNWDVDFAAWCNYKYCNSGPGAVGGTFIHSKFFTTTPNTNHFYIPQLPIEITTKRLDGWWGQKLSDRFGMQPNHVPIAGAQAWQMSNPPVTSLICIEASYTVFEQVGGMVPLRNKSLSLTHYLEALLNYHIIGKPNTNNIEVKIITPTDPQQRGAQISIEFSASVVSQISHALVKRGVICDERKPKVIRISPAPLYNSFSDVFRAVLTLKEILNTPLE